MQKSLPKIHCFKLHRVGLLVTLLSLCSTLLFVNTAAGFKTEPAKFATGLLKGKVVDAVTNEALIGVTVVVKGTGLGGSTDVEGNYSIKDVPEGTYDISISYIGYETALIPNIKIVSGQPTTLNYNLKSASTELEVVEIIGDKALSGKVIESTDRSLLNSIRASLLITTGISAQQIARSADQNAGEVAQRLPGVTVISNFVNIRGMNERYNLTILNGMVAPSSEADKRAFSFDLLPSNMIDKMTVYRSPAPELLADWAGGVIKIDTKNSSVAREIEVNMSTSYRSNSSFKDYYTYKGGKKDWMGKDDGTRALPDGFPEVAAIPAGGITSFGPLPTRNLETFTTEEIAENASLGRSLYNNYELTKENTGLDYRAGINYYDSRLFGRMRLSNLTAINTTQSKNIRYQAFAPNNSIRYGEPIKGGSEIYQDTINQQVSRWGILQNLALTINPRHSVQLNGLFNQLGIDEVAIRDGYNSAADLGGLYITKMLYTYRSRTLLGIQASGKHSVGNNDDAVHAHTISWAAAYNSSSEAIPAQRNLNFRPASLTSDESTPRILYGGSLSFNIDNNLFYSDTKETNTIFSLDFEKKLKIGPTIKVGFFNENKLKVLTSRLVRTGVPGDNPAVNRSNPEDNFKSEGYKDDGSGYWISDDNLLSGQYEATGKIYAGYAALNLPLFKNKLKLYGGVRYEGQDLLLIIPPSEFLVSQKKDPELINQYVFYWLPSINASFNFTPKLTLRTAYGKTINRPNYRELIPIYVFDPRLDNRTVGNDSLKDAQISNFDLRLEYYPNEGEFISVGAYYKKLTNAIEPYVTKEGNNENVYFDNTKGATVLGVEVELRKSFTFLPWAWGRNLSAIANFAILESEIELRDGLYLDKTGDFRDSRVSKRPLEGTANFVANAGFYYDHVKWGTKLAAIYNVFGQRLIIAGTADFPDTYEMPRHSLDLTLRQPIAKFIELRFSVQDVLNQPRKQYRDYDRDQRYDPYKRNKLAQNDWIYQEFKPGQYFTLGINLKI